MSCHGLTRAILFLASVGLVSSPPYTEAASPKPSQNTKTQPREKSRPATIDDIMNIRNVLDVRISPNGEDVLYVISEPDLTNSVYHTNVWTVSTHGGDPVQLTKRTKKNDSPRWSPDGKTVAFLSDRSGKPQIWLIASTGGKARKLTDVPGGVKDLEWAPDGKSIAYRATDAETPAQAKRKKTKDDVVLIDRHWKMDCLHVTDLTGKKTRRLTKGEFHVADFSWSPDSSHLAYTVQPTPSEDDIRRTDIAIVPAAGGKSRMLVERPGPDFQPRWSPDGRSIAFLSRDGQADTIGNRFLCVVPAEGGEPRNLSKGFDEHFVAELPAGFAWAPDGKTIYSIAQSKVRQHLFALSVETGEVRPVSTGDRVYHRFSLSKDGSRVAVAAEEVTHPAEVFVSAVSDFSARNLTTSNPHLRDVTLGETEVVRWKSKDGLAVEGLLIKPVAYKEGIRYPLLTYVHGGPALNFRLAFTPYGTSPQAQRYPIQVFAGLGYAVFCPNPRGSGGYGEKFRQANIRDWGGRDFEDMMTGIDSLIERGIADRDRLGLMGWSYGGFMTAWAVTQTDRFKAASAGAGVTDPFSMYGQTDIPSFMDAYFGGPPWKVKDAYDRCTSIRFAGNIKTPTLIQHGERDERVPLAQSQELHVALKRSRVPVEFAVYPRQGHVVGEPRLQADVLRRNVDWFERCLLGLP
jgi:dipeptidyl aminopeptidase/acylaminoacyl peptidase